MAVVTKAFAPAKINLTLHVTGQRADGYHRLDSLVAFADVGDVLTLREGQGLTLDVFGPKARHVPTDASNSILQAAVFLGQDNLAFGLEKNLPAQAGIGGGTSDAAAALRAIADLRGVDIPGGLEALGADVPVCALARAARMSGIGEIVRPITLPTLPAVLVNPGASVATPAVFRALMSKENAPMPSQVPEFRDVSACADWLSAQRNDLEVPAMGQARVIEQVLGDLTMTGGNLLARMSGSGATCFGLYATKAQAQMAASELASAHPDWWVVDCELS